MRPLCFLRCMEEGKDTIPDGNRLCREMLVKCIDTFPWFSLCIFIEFFLLSKFPFLYKNMRDTLLYHNFFVFIILGRIPIHIVLAVESFSERVWRLTPNSKSSRFWTQSPSCRFYNWKLNIGKYDLQRTYINVIFVSLSKASGRNLKFLLRKSFHFFLKAGIVKSRAHTRIDFYTRKYGEENGPEVILTLMPTSCLVTRNQHE